MPILNGTTYFSGSSDHSVCICVYVYICVSLLFLCFFFVRQNWNTQLLRRRPATHAPTEGEGHVPLEYMEGRR